MENRYPVFVRITSSSGSPVYSQMTTGSGTQILNIENELSPGMYFINITCNNYMVSKKLMVK